MHISLLTAVALTLPTLCLTLKIPRGKVQSSDVVEGAYLIQLSTGSAFTDRDSRASQSDAHDVFHKRAATSQLDCRFPLAYQYGALNVTSSQVIGGPGQIALLIKMLSRFHHTQLHET